MYQSIDLKTLSSDSLHNLCFDSVGQLVLIEPEKRGELNPSNTTIVTVSKPSQKLKIDQVVRLRSVIYWMNHYQPGKDASQVEQVRGYLEAFYQLCELCQWDLAYQLMTQRLDSGEELHEQLGNWGYSQEQIDLYSPLLGKLSQSVDGLCLNGLGHAYRTLGNYKKALEFHEQQLELSQKLDKRKLEGWAWAGIGETYRDMEWSSKAIDCYRKQLKMAQEIQDKEQESSALFGLGKCMIFSDPSKSIEFYKRSLFVCGMNDIEKMFLPIKIRLIEVYYFNKKDKKAMDLYHEIKDEVDWDCCQIQLMAIESKLYAFLGETEKGIKLAKQTLEYSQKKHINSSEVVALNTIGIICIYLKKDYKMGIFYLKKLIEKYELYQGFDYKKSVNFASLSHCYAALGELAEAKKYALKSIAYARQSELSEAIGISWGALGSVYWHQGHYLQGLLMAFKALWFLPPWKSANGAIIFQTLIDLVKAKISWVNRRSPKTPDKVKRA